MDHLALVAGRCYEAQGFGVVAAKERKLNYHNQETLLLGMYLSINPVEDRLRVDPYENYVAVSVRLGSFCR